MSNLAQIAEHLAAIHEEFEELEAKFTQRDQLAYDSSPARIPELVAEGIELAKQYRMPYAICRTTSGRYHLAARAAVGAHEVLVLIGAPA